MKVVALWLSLGGYLANGNVPTAYQATQTYAILPTYAH